MKLKCDDKEIEPIQAGKQIQEADIHDYYRNFTDVTFNGFYTYLPDAISASCGKVTLELYSEKKPDSPTVKVLDPKSLLRISADFEAYRQTHPRPQ
jgi:hypothetical protein